MDFRRLGYDAEMLSRLGKIGGKPLDEFRIGFRFSGAPLNFADSANPPRYVIWNARRHPHPCRLSLCGEGGKRDAMESVEEAFDQCIVHMAVDIKPDSRIHDVG